MPAHDCWVFAYGSLMWKPDFRFTESAPGKIFGFRRELCLLSVVHRGTHERPGLVFGLAMGGSCIGRAFRVDESDKEEVLEYLWRREMIRDAYIPRLVKVHMEQGVRHALTFVVDTRHPQYVQNLSNEKMAAIVSRGCGNSGPNVDYFLDSLKKFEEFGIRMHRYNRIKDLIGSKTPVR